MTETIDARVQFGRGFWNAYATGFAALTIVYAMVLIIAGSAAPLSLRSGVAAILPNAALGVAAVRLARASAERRDPPPAFALRHAAAVLALSILATAGWAVLITLDQWIANARFEWQSARIVVLFEALISALVQIALLGATHAWISAQRFSRAEALRARAEMALLRSQLNPHFMLNTLHAMLGLVRQEPALVEGALEKLGELLRFGLQVHSANLDQVSLREEWAFVMNYLALESMRFGDRLRANTEVEDEALDAIVPPFVLQPLVENAIVHAVGPRREGGAIRLSARRDGTRLVLEVEDDGPGLSAETLAASPRLGLRLLRERLRALYGGAARIDFLPSVPRGLRVRLDLPEDGVDEQ